MRPFHREFAMKRWIAMGALVVGAAQAWAVPATAASVERLLVLTRADAVIEGMRPQMTAMMKAAAHQAAQGKSVSPQEQKVLDKFFEQANAVMAEELNMTKMKPFFVEVYTAHYSQEEVNGIIAFYESPVGQSLLSKQPAVMQTVLAGMPKLLAVMVERTTQLDVEMRAELKAVRDAAKPASPAAEVK
ncbi:MAG: hypothetical protein CFE44_11780 [Burkholderiales bacterium PBB4]|nr:MAG: hypothetical protein CFE44_11780 [Burkholderiales bacterium PBB4]